MKRFFCSRMNTFIMKAAMVLGIVAFTAGTVFGQVKGKIDERKYLEQPKKPSIGLLKDKPFAEKPAFAEKKAPKIQLVQREDVQEALVDGIPFARFPKGTQVAHDYSAQPKENVQLGKVVEDKLGIQFENAKAYYSLIGLTGGVKNGVQTRAINFPGSAIEAPFFANGNDLFVQGQVVANDTCDWSNYPPGSDAKISQMRMFYMQNVGPWDISNSNDLDKAAEAMRQLAVKHGEPYIGFVLLRAPRGELPTKWMFLTSTYLKGDGTLAGNPPMGFGIVGIGMPDSYLFPTNSAYLNDLTTSLLAPVKKWNWIDQDNFDYEVRGASVGAYMLDSYGIPRPAQACITVQSIITSVEQIPGMPTSFSLSQNYPNPFNPTTNISFSLPKYAHVRLVVYDVLGREIATLVNQDMPTGSYEVKFDGSKEPSGIYLYRIEADEFTQTKKMILIK